MAKCATCVFHEKDKCMESAWFLANYIEAKTMRFPCVYRNAWKLHAAQLAMYFSLINDYQFMHYWTYSILQALKDKNTAIAKTYAWLQWNLHCKYNS